MMNQLKKHFLIQDLRLLLEILRKSNDSELNKATVRLIESGLIDFQKEINDV